MSDEEAKQVYAAARLGQSVTLGSRPAVLVVDFSCGFTDPDCTLGADMTAEVEATRRLLERRRGDLANRSLLLEGPGVIGFDDVESGANPRSHGWIRGHR